ncbi:MAG: IS256 family transposase [Clostridia bacterium]|nr:IS256 family transposase [Clostridia bacterium]
MLELVSKLPQNENDLLSFSLDELARLGAKKILIKALSLEVEQYINKSKDLMDDQGKRLVVRNGKAKERKVTVGSGTIKVKAPRVNDRREGEKFSSKILPPYLRKSPNIESILPILYLKGLSGNAFVDGLKELLGDDVGGLSSSSISTLKRSWEKELKTWNQRDILEEFIYLWCDGVHVPVRLGDNKKASLLVVVGVNRKGEKKLLSVVGGYRESTLSWKEIFLSLIKRGLKPPLMIIGDGGLGLWSAIREIEKFREVKEQRCWVHKIANVLDKLPKKLQAQAKKVLHEIMRAPDRTEAGIQLKLFKDLFSDKYVSAYNCLEKDWKELTAFYDFPAKHWTSIRTSNPIESTFATVKLRTKSMRGAGSVNAAEAMAFKLLKEAEKKWRQIRGWQEIENLLRGDIYIDGKLVQSSSTNQEVVA